MFNISSSLLTLVLSLSLPLFHLVSFAPHLGQNLDVENGLFIIVLPQESQNIVALILIYVMRATGGKTNVRRLISKLDAQSEKANNKNPKLITHQGNSFLFKVTFLLKEKKIHSPIPRIIQIGPKIENFVCSSIYSLLRFSENKHQSRGYEPLPRFS